MKFCGAEAVGRKPEMDAQQEGCQVLVRMEHWLGIG